MALSTPLLLPPAPPPPAPSALYRIPAALLFMATRLPAACVTGTCPVSTTDTATADSATKQLPPPAPSTDSAVQAARVASATPRVVVVEPPRRAIETAASQRTAQPPPPPPPSPPNEAYILATPPPRRQGYKQRSQLLYQLQRLDGRHVVPLLNITTKSTSSSASSPPPPRSSSLSSSSSSTAASILPARPSRSLNAPSSSPLQFSVNPCDIAPSSRKTKHAPIVSATAHDLHFRYDDGLVWRVRRAPDALAPTLVVVAVAQSHDPTGATVPTERTLGRWTRTKASSSGTSDVWTFTAARSGAVLATLRGARMELRSPPAIVAAHTRARHSSRYAAEDAAATQQYVGALHFGEALALTCVFIAAAASFAAAPALVDSATAVAANATTDPTQSPPTTAAAAAAPVRRHASISLVRRAATMPSRVEELSSVTSRFGGSLLRRGRSLLLRRSSAAAN
ncbi:uncharacterized protein V1518DRAFT_409938 [Limtongia smithiae]|uniref:uncharacterized protein n=1 Tax=Limtongia smithiae TaxID=1125753 RepID=UPI0034CD9469